MKQLAKYLLVGVLNSGFGYAIIFSCMYLLHMRPEISNVIGYGFGMVISYALNRDFTFERVATGRSAAMRFIFVGLVAYSANLGMLLALIHYAHLHEGVAQVLAGGVYVATSFLIYKFYVFRAPAKN
ncbi:GtrA family protein [Rhodoferax sp.]|uniref:GtrA family protein n=1 Tax=Rhodoferax sp. TaxID=50421 RepID=UPI00374CD149